MFIFDIKMFEVKLIGYFANWCSEFFGTLFFINDFELCIAINRYSYP